MNLLKIDRTKCKTPKTYAKEKGITVQQAYNILKKGEVDIVEIDGVKFFYG